MKPSKKYEGWLDVRFRDILPEKGKTGKKYNYLFSPEEQQGTLKYLDEIKKA